jgi:hypothetical protein
MSILIPLPASGLAVTYTSQTKILEVSANGKIPGWIIGPFIQHDLWSGGLKFSLKGYAGGEGVRPDQPLNISFKENIGLPMPHFNNKTVLVETATGTFNIPIRYLGITLPDATPSPTSADNQPNTSVLPPINEYLPEGQVLTITAKIPDSFGSSVAPQFNSEYLQIVDAIVKGGQITWTFKWTQIPQGPANPQLLNILTRVLGTNPIISETIQGYVVHFVVLQ